MVTAKQLIKKHEGFSQFAYQCQAGKTTIGYGRNIDKNGGVGISELEADILLNSDIDRILGDLYTFTWFSGLNHARKSALVDMVYNLGFAGFCKFNDVISAFERHDFPAASRAMIDSRWAEQVGNRAVELAELIKNGG